MTIEELTKQFTELKTSQETMQKDMEIKLQATQNEAKQYKELAEKREADLRKLTEDGAKAKQEQEKKFQELRAKEVDEFIDAQVKAGKIIPAMTEQVKSFMLSLNGEQKVSEFKEADGSTKTHTQLSLFKAIFSALKTTKAVEFREVGYSFSTPSSPDNSTADDGAEQFAEVLEKGVKKQYPMQDIDLHMKVLEYQEAHKGVDYGTALLAVSPKKLTGKK